MRGVACLAIVSLTLSAQSAVAHSLRVTLHEKARSGHKALPYKKLWSVLADLDKDVCAQGRLRLFYTDRTQDKTLSGRRNNSNKNAWNREHLWPQSRGAKKFPMKSDLHHVRPADASVNNNRGNLDFGEGGRPEGEAPDTFMSATTFEPRDEIKGDIARSLFYMDVRYEGSGREPDLQLVKKVQTTREGRHMGNLCQLLIWHQKDPVDQSERRRHGRIAEIQGNRNPFIDDPEVAEQLYGDQCSTKS